MVKPILNTNGSPTKSGTAKPTDAELLEALRVGREKQTLTPKKAREIAKAIQGDYDTRPTNRYEYDEPLKALHKAPGYTGLWETPLTDNGSFHLPPPVFDNPQLTS